MTHAVHSCGITESDGSIVYGGEAAGYVLKFGDGRTIYFAGDTGLFGDMRLFGERYAPSIAFLPIASTEYHAHQVVPALEGHLAAGGDHLVVGGLPQRTDAGPREGKGDRTVAVGASPQRRPVIRRDQDSPFAVRR